MLSVEVVKDLEQLHSIEEEWSGLLARCPHRTLFLTFEWISTWCRYFGEDSRLRILLLRDEGELVLVAPLSAHSGPAFRHLSWMQAAMLHSTSNYHSNRFDFIYAHARDEYFEFIWDHLYRDSRWNFLRLYPVPASSETLKQLLRISGKKGIPATVVKSQTSPYISIDRSWESYTREISSEMRRKGRKAEREQAAKELDFEIVDGPVAELDAIVDEIFEVAASAWAGEEGTAISSTPKLRGFYRELAHQAHQRGWLFFSLLRYGGELAAFAYNLLYEGKIYNLKVAFRPDFRKKNPGHSLAWLTLKHAFGGDGIKEFDFLGEDDPYKLKWTSAVRLHSKVTLYNRESAFGRFIYWFEKGFVQQGRKMRTAIRKREATATDAEK